MGRRRGSAGVFALYGGVLECAQRLGLQRQALHKRVTRNGWSIEQAVVTPACSSAPVPQPEAEALAAKIACTVALSPPERAAAEVAKMRELLEGLVERVPPLQVLQDLRADLEALRKELVVARAERDDAKREAAKLRTQRDEAQALARRTRAA